MKFKWWWYLVPFIILQLPFAFSPMCVWDTAVQEHLYNSKNFDCAKELFFNSGVPLSYYEMLPLAMLSNFILYFKLISVVVFCICSFATSMLLEKLNAFNSLEIYFISVLTFFYPAYALWNHFIMFPYYISLLAFTLGILSYLRFNQSYQKAWLLFTLILLIIAFNIQSFLVYHYVLLACFFFFNYQLNTKFSIRVLSFLKSNWIFIFLPLAYYFTINHFFPKAGFYKEDGYNSISTNLTLIISELAKSMINTTLTPANEALKYFISDLISSGIYLGIALLLTLLIGRKVQNELREKFSFKLFFIALLLAIFTLVPYAMVGKHVSTHGYETRHSFLAHTPLLICIVLLFRLFQHYAKYFIYAFMVFSFFMFLKQEVHWENRYRKFEAIELQLKQNEKNIGDIVFFTEKNHLWQMDEYLRFYECNMMLKDAFKTEGRLGINDERKAHNMAQAEEYINKYLKYKDCLFFNSFSGATQITEIEIEEKKQEDANLFLNALTVPDKRTYYSNYLTVTIK